MSTLQQQDLEAEWYLQEVQQIFCNVMNDSNMEVSNGMQQQSLFSMHRKGPWAELSTLLETVFRAAATITVCLTSSTSTASLGRRENRVSLAFLQ